MIANKQDLLTRLGAEVAEFVISNRGNDSSQYTGKLRQLQMFRDAVQYSPHLTQGHIDVLFDEGATLESMLEHKKKYHIDGETEADYFRCAGYYADKVYTNHQLTILRGRLQECLDAFIAEIKQLPVDAIIEKAYEIAEKQSIVEKFDYLDSDDFDPQQADAFLTFENPLEEFYGGWPSTDHDDVMDGLSNIASEQLDELMKTSGDITDNPDIQRFRQNYMSKEANQGWTAFAEHLEALKNTVEAEYNAVRMSVGPPALFQQMERARAAYYAYTFNPIEVEVMLTYAQPLQEIINQAARHSTDYESAVISAIGERQAVLSGYMAQLDQLPDFLQGPVREFQARCEAAQLICASTSLGTTGEAEYEPEQ